MTAQYIAYRLALLLALAITAGAASANQVYRWVDADGVVHFSDSPPPENEAENVETVDLPNAPAVPAVTPDSTSAAPPSSRVSAQASSERTAPAAPPAQAANIADMSLAALDKRCEDAREREIAPLREAAIAECQANRRNDPDWCVRFNADFGDAGRTVNGTMRPRMFDDLPECVDALNERNRRPR